MSSQKHRSQSPDSASKRPRVEPIAAQIRGAEFVLGFKEWLLTQPSMSERDAVEKYEEYKEQHLRQALEEFFSVHKRSHWFREKYLPELASKREAYLHDCAKRRLAVFGQLKSEGHFNKIVLSSEALNEVRRLVVLINLRLEDVRDQTEFEELIEEDIKREASRVPTPPAAPRTESDPAKPSFHAPTSTAQTTPPAASNTASAGDADGRGDEVLDYEPDEPPVSSEEASRNARARDKAMSFLIRRSRTLYSRGLPPTVTRAELEASLATIPGFRRVALSVPNENDVQVTAWIVFSPQTVLADHRARLAELSPPLRCSTLSADLKLVNALPVSPTDLDRPLLTALAEHFDTRRGIKGQRDEHISIYELILYLRIVHSYDYYSAMEFDIENELAHRCCMLSVHSVNVLLPLNNADAPRLPHHIHMAQARLAPAPTSTSLATTSPEAATARCVAQHTRQLKPDVFQCTACAKLFKTEDFVSKHVAAKHPDIITQATTDAVMLNNYLKDPHRPLFGRRRIAPSLPLLPGFLPYPVSGREPLEESRASSSHDAQPATIEFVKDQFGRDRPVALRSSPPPAARTARRQLADYGSLLLPQGAP
eukprot:m.9407 g.9407  ORF g.9407 m.9407 type:complete len:596 (+) comp5408_c0_seq1:27-1814(+)